MSDLVYHPDGVKPPELVTPGAALWLDDVRRPPTGWDWVTCVPAAIAALERQEYEIASLDHDLGLCDDWDGQEGYHLVNWMIEHNVWPTEAVYVHSWNVVGAQHMCDLINRYGPYKRLVRPTPAETMPYVSEDSWYDLEV